MTSVWEDAAMRRLQHASLALPPKQGPITYSEAFLNGFAHALALQLAPLETQRRYRLAFNRWLAEHHGRTLEEMEAPDQGVVEFLLGGLPEYDADDTSENRPTRIPRGFVEALGDGTPDQSQDG